MPRITHFDIPADDPIRAQKFYSKVFDWKFEKWNGPMEYWMAYTGEDKQPGINGGLAKRMPGQAGITNTIEVPDIDKYLKLIQSNGGHILVPKIPIQGVGHFSQCVDTEGNMFGIIQLEQNA